LIFEYKQHGVANNSKEHDFDLIISTEWKEFGEQVSNVLIRNNLSLEPLDIERRNPKSCKSEPDDDNG
jgi:hypothetical protein